MDRRVLMAKMIEFYIPARFKPQVKWIPLAQRGKILIFQAELKKSACTSSEIAASPTRRDETQFRQRAVVSGFGELPDFLVGPRFRPRFEVKSGHQNDHRLFAARRQRRRIPADGKGRKHLGSA